MTKTQSRESTLTEYGSLKDEPGSKEWCVAVRDHWRLALNNAAVTSKAVEDYKRLFIEHRGWEKLSDSKRHRFMSYEAFCIASPPHGLGYEPEAIDGIVAERKSAEAMAARAKPLPDTKRGRPRKDAKPDDADDNFVANKFTSGSTNAEYLTARIARDRPDILERMLAGEFPSVRKVGIAAGIVKVPTARRAGEMLREMEKQNGARGIGKKVESQAATPLSKLADLGISKTQSSHCRT